MTRPHTPPPAQGLYDPAQEHDACGVCFVVDIKGRKSRRIIDMAITGLEHLSHRGACGCEENTGDGAGILMQMPDKFLRKACEAEGIALPEPGRYGAGIVFLPPDPIQANHCETQFEAIIRAEGCEPLGWREMPSDLSPVGPTARAGAPRFRQLFIGGFDPKAGRMDVERKLYVIRKQVEHAIAKSDLTERLYFHIPSLSAQTIVYKGMLTSHQLAEVFPELRDPDMETALALVHSRFSTNTFPSWPRAHPYRYLCHNGEINTLRGNINWMHAREALCRSEHFPELEKLLPIVVETGSDSAMFDNVLEFLYMGGYELPHAMLMMIPEPWSGHESMDEERKAFYEYHGCIMEPWDGPASIAFTDGTTIGAVLDRNGLRPSRYYVTKDGLVVMASEVGVLDILPENVLLKERLHPGRIFLVDTAEGRIIDDEEIKRRYASAKPYKKWLDGNLVPLEKLPDAPELPEPDHETVLQRQMAFGYTEEDLRFFLAPMALKGDDPVGSMGTDTALPVLSNRSRLLYDYFKQLFAQVTNPPLDCIREELVTQMSVTIGAGGNLLNPDEASCRQIKLESPILDNEGLAKIGHVKHPFFKAARLPILFPAKEEQKGLQKALDDLFAQADRAIAGGHNIIVISDRGVNETMAPVPALLATAGLHHHLVRSGTRTRVGLVLETGQARQVHQMCVLIGYGANAINPYLAFETLDDMIRGSILTGLDHKAAVKNYIKALKKGILKVISKMGISTIQSYCGAQVFEAVGLNKEFVDRYFTWTASRVGGIGLDVVTEETLIRHRRAFPERPAGKPALDVGGEIQWRRDGEIHLFNPETVFKLQHATRTGQFGVFREYTKRVDDQSRGLATLRGLFEFKPARKPVPLEEVEPVESVVKRFATGAMSYGSISQEAHETLAIAMNRLGGKSNTGEGGEDPARYVPDANGDSRRSAIKQVASGRFGVTSEYLVNADDLQIKMAQGAKPGEGGQLPGHKVYPWIAKVRYSTPGVGLISPPPHHDIYSIEDLAQLIYDLKNGNPRARIHVKLVSEVGVGTVAAGVAKAHSDVVLISGHDGGTGASPITSIKHAGTPWELGLAETQQVLVLNKLRDRIVVQVDGQLKTGRDVVIAALLGADEFGFATAPLVVMGCVMMRVCHLNTCPVGIATQDPELRKKFTGKPEFVENFFRFIAQEVREYMSLLGFRTMAEMIGRVDRINVRKALDHWKAKGLDYAAILHKPDMGPGVAIRCVRGQDHGLEKTLDMTTLLPACREAVEKKAPVTLRLRIENVNRTVGTILGSEISRRHGAEGLPEDTVSIHFKGSAGQSFGAFIPKGVTLILEGDSNDYMGKGLSGGKIVVFPPRESSFTAERNILIGNVALYGATGGEAYFRGIAGERFCVRNSGAHTVVEGVGDHGCEYMTGGRVVVLGRSGRNFAAGMSGGIAYVLDEAGDFRRRCNMEMVDLEELVVPDDVEEAKTLIRSHANYTGSEVAQRVLARWAECQPKFVKIMPRDYKRALTAIQRAKEQGIPWEVAVMEGAHG
ncbi:MAG: glutamate synthase subunit alpha [Candidatus Tectomicrobia bacterium RIFCSPLOWO2_12_FULL_69_37]|nr:MAG: glutamate synthase subunit alpha [Candidatus Tectomicrobia bacterium RIFCSPLOWO2_12_FULL_69_37]